MGALLSIPMIPVQMAGTAIASFVGSSASSVAGSVFTGLFGGQISGIASRVAYAFLFLLNSILSWLTLSPWLKAKLDLLRYACNGEECTSFVAVHRISSSLGMLHVLLATILAYRYRSSIQNGWWRSKIAIYVLNLVLAFFMLPAGFWVSWGNYVAPVFSFIFVFIGLILLVDFAHSWAETCIEHVEEEADDEKLWKIILVGSTVGMYIAAVALSIVMYWKFATDNCNMNQAAITLNIILAIIASVMSVHPRVQEYNPKAGLAQSAMVTVYCTYLVLSAVTSEPDDKSCNPMARSGATRKLTTALGAAFTLVAIAYTTTRAASKALIGDSETTESGAIALNSDSRRRVLEQAVREGSLPASALEQSQWVVDEDEEGASNDGYNYIVFHIIFFLATQYTASILTINVHSDPADNFVPVGRSYFASWVKIVSSWICYLLYSWSLIAPVMLPDRF